RAARQVPAARPPYAALRRSPTRERRRLGRSARRRAGRVPGVDGRPAAPAAGVPRAPRRQAARGVPPPALGMTLAITNPRKVFWPGEGYTKLDVARHYDPGFPHIPAY